MITLKSNSYTESDYRLIKEAAETVFSMRCDGKCSACNGKHACRDLEADMMLSEFAERLSFMGLKSCMRRISYDYPESAGLYPARL